MFDIKRGKRLTVEKRIKGGRPLITAGYENTGVAEFIGNQEQEIFPENTITIDMFGNTFFRDYIYSADDNILVLFEKEEISVSVKKFVTSLINKRLGDKFNYGKQYRMGSFDETKISLPTKNGEIDFDFMENFIDEVEAEKIKNLDEYLEENNLKDYVLTEKEQKILEDFESGKFEWGEYIIGDLFKIQHYGKQRSKEDLQKKGDLKYNFVMQNQDNNGVVEKVPEQIGNNFNLIPENSISAFTHLNKVYYQEKPFYSKQGSNVYTLKSDFLNKQNSKFIISSINTNIREVEYGKNTASRLRKYNISLPTKNFQPDYEKMEILISAIQKIIMKDLVLYVEKKK